MLNKPELPRHLTVWNHKGHAVRLDVLERQHAALKVRLPDGRITWVTTEPEPQEDFR